MKLEHSLTPYTKINLKCIKDISVRPDPLKLLEENLGRTLFEITTSNYSNTILPQETRNISSKQPKLTPKAIRE